MITEEYLKDLSTKEMAVKVFKHWGERKQTMKFIEELCELSTELSRVLIDEQGIIQSGALELIAGELADVLFMGQQFRQFIGEKIIDDVIRQKAERTMVRIDEAKRNAVG